MRRERTPQLPPELEVVAEQLRAARAKLAPLELDGCKRSLLAKQRRRGRSRAALRTRLATILTIVGLVGSTGGALAIAGTASRHAASDAAAGQYTKPKKCGTHGHPKPCHHRGGGGTLSGRGKHRRPPTPASSPPSVGPTSSQAQPSTLPFTGQDLLEVVLVGLVLVGIGLVLGLRSRRT
jgi:hypothetical protein